MTSAQPPRKLPEIVVLKMYRVDVVRESIGSVYVTAKDRFAAADRALQLADADEVVFDHATTDVERVVEEA